MFAVGRLETMLVTEQSESRAAIAKGCLMREERKIADLRVPGRRLASMIEQCRCATVADCRIIEALSH